MILLFTIILLLLPTIWVIYEPAIHIYFVNRYRRKLDKIDFLFLEKKIDRETYVVERQKIVDDILSDGKLK